MAKSEIKSIIGEDDLPADRGTVSKVVLALVASGPFQLHPTVEVLADELQDYR